MKGLLGRKIGMTSVFSDHGKNIPVTVLEVQPNVVTAVLTQDKNGYTATQLSAFDRRDKTSSKPQIGHFKKAGTTAKYFVREVRGMEGHELGSQVDVSLFVPGELVDITGISKGKGFQGSIKRHNQKIGPKGHGGGGGSKPVRLTGSLGDLISNRVFKGMTMPGHMGNEKVTVQNLEVVSIDKSQNLILVKGSIPGPSKGYVVIEEAVKGLPSKEAIQLVDVKEAELKNELLKEAKVAGAAVNTEMSIEEMKAAIAAAEEAKAAEKAAKEAEEKAADEAKKAEAVEKAAEKAADDAEKAKASGDTEKAKEAEEKAAALEKQAAAAEESAKEAKAEAKEAEAEAEAKEAEAAELQVEEEAPVEEPEDKKDDKKGDE